MFEVDDLTLAAFSRIRESAGLYAWQEAARNVLNWSRSRQQTVVERALDSISLLRSDASGCNQLALFDPEFEQWHFVPLPPTQDDDGNPLS